MDKYSIGIDIGKTNTKIVCMNSCYSIQYKKETASELSSKESLFKFLMGLIKNEESKLSKSYESIGICLPGLVDFYNQEFLYIPTVHSIPGFSVIELAETLKIEKEKIVIDNDCTAAGFAELKLGSLKNITNAILFSIGTGIGAGIITNGTVYRGVSGFSGEVGHSIFLKSSKKCKCGRIGCYETILPKFGDINFETNNYAHMESVQQFFDSLGNLLGSIINLLNVECITFYGYPFKYDHFKSKLIDYIKKYALKESFNDCSFLNTKFGKWAGAVGSALLSKMKKL